MNGVIGEFFRSFAVSISVAVLFSLFISFTLTPMLASRWFKQTEQFEGEIRRERRAFWSRSTVATRAWSITTEESLRWCIERPWIPTIVGNLALLAAVFVIVPQLGFTFAPEQDQGIVAVVVESPPGSSLAYTQKITDQVEQAIPRQQVAELRGQEHPDAGRAGPAGRGGTGNTGTQYANIQVNLYPKKSPLDYLFFWQHAHLRPDATRRCRGEHSQSGSRDSRRRNSGL